MFRSGHICAAWVLLPGRVQAPAHLMDRGHGQVHLPRHDRQTGAATAAGQFPASQKGISMVKSVEESINCAE